MTLQQTFLTNIESELRTRYNLAHVSSATALQIALAELQGAKTQYHTAKAENDVTGMHQQRQRYAALQALINKLAGE